MYFSRRAPTCWNSGRLGGRSITAYLRSCSEAESAACPRMSRGRRLRSVSCRIVLQADHETMSYTCAATDFFIDIDQFLFVWTCPIARRENKEDVRWHRMTAPENWMREKGRSYVLSLPVPKSIMMCLFSSGKASRPSERMAHRDRARSVSVPPGLFQRDSLGPPASLLAGGLPKVGSQRIRGCSQKFGQHREATTSERPNIQRSSFKKATTLPMLEIHGTQDRINSLGYIDWIRVVQIECSCVVVRVTEACHVRCRASGSMNC
ncbi:hypothetical protein U1Q18_052174 [Sarracenia purpurea var. burkii]